MKSRKEQISVGGLRTSDINQLSVLTQDVLGLPIGQIEPSTLVDLLGLSEIPDQMPKQMSELFADFSNRVIREVDDLPDGAPLASFVNDLAQLDGTTVPSCLRAHMAGLQGERSADDVVEALNALLASWANSEPSPISLPAAPAASPAATKAKAAAAPKKKARRKSANQMDEDRLEWIQEDILSRLVNYGSRGLKQPVIVAGTRHRSPWDDLTDGDVLAVLRKLKRDGKVRHSAGRWILET